MNDEFTLTLPRLEAVRTADHAQTVQRLLDHLRDLYALRAVERQALDHRNADQAKHARAEMGPHLAALPLDWQSGMRLPSPERLTASAVQAMLGVGDHVAVCRGYTHDRQDLTVYFHEGMLVREADPHGRDECVRATAEFFEPSYFADGVKRWYESSAHPKLRGLLETFGGPMNTTPGGHPDPSW